MRQHRVKRTNRKPSFFWQGVLILAPMLVLAKLGALALSQDRRMAEQDATQRAQEFAERAADEVLTELQSFRQIVTNPVVMFRGGWWPSTNQGVIKQIDPDAATLRMELNERDEPVWPPPYEAAPLPRPLNLASLNETQRGFWSAWSQQIRPGADEFRHFLASSPPDDFAAVAWYARGESLLRSDRVQDLLEAESCFDVLTNRYDREFLESGLPIRPLAIFKMFQARQALRNLSPTNRSDPVAEYRDTLKLLLEQPVGLTPELLRNLALLADEPPLGSLGAPARAVHTREARRAWENQERTRKLFAAAHALWSRPTIAKLSGESLVRLPPPAPPGIFWITLRADLAEAVRPLGRKYIDSLPAWAFEPREPEPPPLTLVWSNVMSGEAIERRRRLLSNQFVVRAAKVIFDENWLLIRVTNLSGSTILCRDEHIVEKRIATALQRVRKPDYLDASVRVAGMDVLTSNQLDIVRQVSGGKGSGQFWRKEHPEKPPTVLATATRGLNEGQPLVTLRAHLVSPEMLFSQQEERATLFKLLIGASALASVVGFLFAWRAFRKQLRLAEMKSNFVSSVSHELRAPIASVRLMAEGLERGDRKSVV